MVNLVEFIKGEPRTSSFTISKAFGKNHQHVLEIVDRLAVEIPTTKFNAMYAEGMRQADRGRSYREVTMTRDGYMFLVMNISSKKAHEKKLSFIEAFNQMERVLLKQAENGESIEWVGSRTQSKQARLQQTDVIKEFVDYATGQGSRSAKFYYKHITNATYKSLQLIQHKNPKLRDTLNVMELAQLMVAQNVAKQSLRKYMEAGEHYKTIFLLVKQDLETLGSSLMIEEQ